MQYKAVNRSSQYLIHFNKNHDPKNGRFTFAKIGDVVKGVATDVGRGFKGGAKVVVKGVSDSGVGDKLKKVGGGLKSVGSEVGRGFKNATNTVKKELNDPSSADFNGDKVSTEKKPPEAFKTSELDEKSKVLEPVIDKVAGFSKVPWLKDNDDAVAKWGKEYVDAADIGLKACKVLNLRDAYDDEITNGDRSWFVKEDQTFGMPQIAYLASIGKTNREINDIIDANQKLEKANSEYMSQYSFLKNPDEYKQAEKNQPYKTDWYLYESNYQGGDATDDEYINKCIEIANESKVQHSIVVNCGNYLVHYNKNHSKANGQFTSGDGDGDGISDDHHNQKSFKSMSRKEQKAYIKERQMIRGAIGSSRSDIDDEWEKTDEYKKKFKAFSDAYDNYIDNGDILDLEMENWNHPKVKAARDAFNKAEKDLLISEGEFVCNRLLKEYGAKDIAELSFGWVPSMRSMQGRSTVEINYDGTIDDLVKKYAETNYGVHRM